MTDDLADVLGTLEEPKTPAKQLKGTEEAKAHSRAPELLMVLILIYLATAIGLTPGGSGTVHTINTQDNTNNNRATR